MKRPIEKQVSKVTTVQPFPPFINKGKITHNIEEKMTKSRNALVEQKESVLPQTNFLKQKYEN